LFQHVDQAVEKGQAVELSIPDEKSEDITHYFRIVYNDIPGNEKPMVANHF